MAKCKVLVPLGDRVLVRQFEKDSVSKGGIVLPDAAGEEKYVGEVVAIGCDIPEEILGVGAVVQFASYAGEPVALNEGDSQLLLLKFENILGIVKEVDD